MPNYTERRLRDRSKFRQAVLDAARELLTTSGEAGLTLRRVAEKIGYSATAIYLHFPNKRCLLTELCLVDLAAAERPFRQAERMSDPLAGLRQTAVAYLDFGIKHPWHYQVLFVTPKEGGSVERGSEVDADLGTVAPRSAVDVLYGHLYAAVFRALAAKILRVDLPDAQGATQTLWAGLHGLVSMQLIRSDSSRIKWRPLDERSDAMIDCLLRGLLRHPESLA